MSIRLSRQEVIGISMEYGDKAAFRIGRMSAMLDNEKRKVSRERLRIAIIEQIKAINDIREFLGMMPLVIEGFETISIPA